MSEVPTEQLAGRIAAVRARAAAAAEIVADQADHLAGILERAAQRGDKARRLELAAVEREISRIERRNADKLRNAGPGPLQLEHLPPLPAFKASPTAGQQPPVVET
jgi:hypothetical protein